MQSWERGQQPGEVGSEVQVVFCAVGGRLVRKLLLGWGEVGKESEGKRTYRWTTRVATACFAGIAVSDAAAGGVLSNAEGGDGGRGGHAACSWPLLAISIQQM